MADLIAEVERFREWASDHVPAPRSGEWECEYNHWDDLYSAVLDHVAASPPEAWSDEELHAVLYALARDNESEHIAVEIGRYPTTLVALADAALRWGEPDARWQMAEQLGHLGHPDDEAERLLLSLASDEAEYVRRRALDALVRLGSPAVERLALEAWHTQDEHQEWARIMALDCLHRIGSSHLERLRIEAERDERQHLRDFAERIRQGGGD